MQRPTLKLGSGIRQPDIQDDVRVLQQFLKKLQFLPSTAVVDGIFGEQVDRAVKSFQQSKKLKPDGIVGPTTWATLEKSSWQPTPIQNIPTSPPILRKGQGKTSQEQTQIRRLQTLLKQAGFLPSNVVIDGLFGQQTENAVIAFQKTKNITADGVVSLRTWQLLEQATSQPTPTPPVTQPTALQRPILSQGSEKNPDLQDDIRYLQTLLKKIKYLPDSTLVDGVFGLQTETAVRAFQRNQNLTVDGRVIQSTWVALEKFANDKTPEPLPVINPPSNNSQNPILRKGHGIDNTQLADAVKRLQSILKILQLLPMQRMNDGRFDDQIENAVKDFQRSKQLLPDGIVWSQTWIKLEEEANKITNPPQRPPVVPVITPPSQEETGNNPVPTIPLSNKPTLRLGSGKDDPTEKETVKELQSLLKKAKIVPDTLAVDGIFSSPLEIAIKSFQKQQKIADTGVVDPMTWGALEIYNPLNTVKKVPILRQGDGLDFPDLIDEVKELQTQLQQKNFLPLNATIDGLFGGTTTNAVKTFQKSHNLTDDGIVGLNTWWYLLNQAVEVFVPVRKWNLPYDVDRIVSTIENTTTRKFAINSIPLILKECQRYGVTDKGQISYVLATALHESRLGQWMVEFASGEQYEWRRDLGNTQPGDGVKYKGRGFVQITGRKNYTDWAERLKLDLVNQPQLATDPAIASKILVLGMREGTFTKHRLIDHINGSKQDFVNARRIINGLDRASHIADLATTFLKVL